MSADYFESLVNHTLKSLNETNNEWQQFLDTERKIPEHTTLEIMSALARVNILLTTKLPQFHRLIDDLRRGQYGDHPINAADLEGIWDLIGLEINDVERRFENLAKQRAMNWTPLEPQPFVRSERKKSAPGKSDYAPRNFDHLKKAARQRLASAKASAKAKAMETIRSKEFFF